MKLILQTALVVSFFAACIGQKNKTLHVGELHIHAPIPGTVKHILTFYFPKNTINLSCFWYSGGF